MWWIDRWRQSTAYTDMTAEEQGLYRNLCDEVWLRDDHVIPNDPRVLARVSGDAEAWERCGEKVLRWMKLTPAGWTQVTALEVIRQSVRRAENQKRYRLRRSNAADNEVSNAAGNVAGNVRVNRADSPSPSPDNVLTEVCRRVVVEAPDNGPPTLPPADRTERAIQATADGLRTKLYALVDAAVEVDPKKRDPVELMRIFTGYTKADGRAVNGVVNAALLTYERLEKSVADAEATVAEWRHGTA